MLIGVLGSLLWWLSSRTDAPETAEATVVVESMATGERVGTPDVPRVVQQASLSGRVRDEQGRGISGASVCVAGFSRTLDRRDAEDVRCVQSEADGGYHITALWPVAYFVRASAPHFIPGQHRRGTRARTLVALRAGQEARDIDVVLQGGGVELRGVVHDLSGGVLEGAQVQAGDADARSGPDGTFLLWVAPGQVYVTARAAGYAQGSAPGRAPGQWFELRLTPESVLVGRVVRAGDRAPLAGASVYAQASDAWNPVGPAITDASGNFRVEGLLPGTYKLEAKHDEAYGMAPESAVLGLGETSEVIEIAAHPAHVVAGTVVRAGGDPCAGGYLRLTEAGRSSRASGIDLDGSVYVQGVLPGTYGVKLECAGAVALPEYPQVVVSDASVSGLRWEVQRGQAIRGQVLAGGAGVRDIWLHAEPQIDPQAPRAHTTSEVRAVTLADGSFELAGLLAGRYRLRANSDEYPTAAVEVALLDGQDLEGVRIALPATGKLRGTVKDESGEPVKGVEVHVRGDGPDGLRTSTVDDGSFRFAHLPAGAYRVTARADHRALRAPGATEDLEGVAAEVVVGAVREVRLVVESRRGRITGRVVDSAGGPLLDAFVEPAREPDGPAMPGVLQGARMDAFFGDVGGRRLTDQDGRFELGGLGEGKYSARV
ncbi:MAG TPA: carboxypeptidase-like regulatory domain-containing protein [Nannocystis sp.]